MAMEVCPVDILTLSCFMDIAKGETYQAVADKNHISQSSLSKMIKHLENELNILLFDRAHRTVTLTEAGQCLYSGLSKIAPQFSGTIEQVRAFSDFCKINCCIVPAPTIFNLDEYLRTFCEKHPAIHMNIANDESAAHTFNLLLNNTYDCAIIHYPLMHSDSIHYTYLCDDPLYLVLPRNHPLAASPFVSIADLSRETILVRPYIYDAIMNSTYIQTFDVFALTIINSQNFRRTRILSQIAYGRSIALFFESDIRNFNLSNVALCQLAEIPSVPLAFLQHADQNTFNKTRVFREYVTTLFTT